MTAPYYQDDMVTLHHGDAVALAADLAPASVQTIVTSPPYWGLRDYGVAGQLGNEPTVEEYVEKLVDLFDVLRLALADDGTVWLNLGDTYAAKARGTDAGWEKSRLSNPGSAQKRQAASLRKTGERHRGKASGIAEKNLVGVPWRVAFALQADGWVLRSEVIWSKPNPMPESVTDRPTNAHEQLFLLAKSPRYYYDADAIREFDTTAHSDPGRRRQNGGGSPESMRGGHRGDVMQPVTGRNKRDVWTVPTQPFGEAHFAVFPTALITPCILSCARPGNTVLDPFSGSGTTGKAAVDNGRRYVGFDLNAEYLDLSLKTRFAQPSLGVEVAS